HRWLGWAGDGALRFDTPEGERQVPADATVLALGGASWPQLGSDGGWVPALAARGVEVAPLRPANCGFDIGWSTHFAQRHAGAPLKPLVVHWRDVHGHAQALQGECVVTQTGLEGSLIYAVSATLRAIIEQHGHAEIALDLAPGREQATLRQALTRPRGGRSPTEHLRRSSGPQGAMSLPVRVVHGSSATQ